MIEWVNLVPLSVAFQKARYDRNKIVMRAHFVAGMTYREIGLAMNRSAERARDLAICHDRQRDPIERYLGGEHAEVLKVFKFLERKRRRQRIPYREFWYCDENKYPEGLLEGLI